MEPVDDEVYTCKSNEYCTDSENICEANPDGVNIIAVCAAQQSSATCSTCTGKTNGQLVCLSTTEFGICRGTTTVESTNPLPCPTDQLCSEELVSQYNLKKVCAPQAVLDYVSANWKIIDNDCINVCMSNYPAKKCTPVQVYLMLKLVQRVFPSFWVHTNIYMSPSLHRGYYVIYIYIWFYICILIVILSFGFTVWNKCHLCKWRCGNSSHH